MILAGVDVLFGVAAIVTAFAGLVAVSTTSVLAFLTRRDLRTVKTGLETKNGLTVGEMVQHGYSMAAQDVPPGDRTDEQKEAVAMLTDQEHSTHADRQRPTDGRT